MAYEVSPFEFDEEVDLELKEAWFADNVHFTPEPDFFSYPFACDLVQHGTIWGSPGACRYCSP